MIFSLPFKAEEDFFSGLYPSDEDVGTEGIGCSHMSNSNGTSSGIVLTFAVIEKLSLSQKIKSLVARKPRVKNVQAMKSSVEQAQQQAESQNYAASVIAACRERMDRAEAVVAKRTFARESMQSFNIRQQLRQQLPVPMGTFATMIKSTMSAMLTWLTKRMTASRGARRNFYHCATD